MRFEAGSPGLMSQISPRNRSDERLMKGKNYRYLFPVICRGNTVFANTQRCTLKHSSRFIFASLTWFNYLFRCVQSKEVDFSTECYQVAPKFSILFFKYFTTTPPLQCTLLRTAFWGMYSEVCINYTHILDSIQANTARKQYCVCQTHRLDPMVKTFSLVPLKAKTHCLKIQTSK